jgi:hypothetical protein
LPIAFFFSVLTHRWMKEPKAGALGQLLAVLLFLSVGSYLAFTAYTAVAEGSIHCFGRRCQSSYSLEQDPGFFWFTFSAFYAAAAFLLSVSGGGIRLMILGPSREP